MQELIERSDTRNCKDLIKFLELDKFAQNADKKAKSDRNDRNRPDSLFLRDTLLNDTQNITSSWYALTISRRKTQS